MIAWLRTYPDRVLAAICAITAVYYSFSTPIFEASDEIFHYPVIEHIGSTGKLPIQDPNVETMWEQEGSQPPLYYLLGAALTFWIDTDDLETVRWLNPHAKLGIPLDADNKNMVIHSEASTDPWIGTVLAVHIIRWFSIALGTATVLLTYRLAEICFPYRRNVWFLATCLVAFNPMFLFITASVNNDNLAILLVTWALLLLVRVVREGLGTRRVITLAFVFALATLTKISGLTLGPLTGIAILYAAWQTRNWKQAALALGAIAIAIIVVAGWWYLRNVRLYGELLGLDTMVAVAGPREISLWALRTEWHGFWLSFWGLFGAVNILLPEGFYGLYSMVTFAGILGLLLLIRKQVQARHLTDEFLMISAMLLQIGIVFVGVIRWTSITFASQGRLMFPVISLTSILIAAGIVEVVPTGQSKFGTRISGVTLFSLAVLGPIFAIQPAYAPHQRITEIPEDVSIVEYHYGDLELVGIEIEATTRRPQDRIPVTLYWRIREEMDEDLSIFLHATAHGNQEIGKIDSYPGGGLLPTSLMEPGQIYVDRYFVGIDDSAVLPSIVRIEVGAGRLTASHYDIIQAVDDGDNPVPNPVAIAGIMYPQSAASCTSTVSEYDTMIGSISDFTHVWITDTSYEVMPGDEIEITLIWDSQSATEQSLTAFVHLIGDDPQPLAQADSPPLSGDYPTNWWTIPCEVADTRTLVIPDDLPESTYSLLVGMYNPEEAGLPRASFTDASGQPYPDNAAPAAIIQVAVP